jgi:hypothetical protein
MFTWMAGSATPGSDIQDHIEDVEDAEDKRPAFKYWQQYVVDLLCLVPRMTLYEIHSRTLRDFELLINIEVILCIHLHYPVLTSY